MGYGMGPNLVRLLKNYWKWQRVLPKVDKCLGAAFGTWRGVKQRDLTYPISFNIVVNVVVRVVLDVVCSPHEAQHDMIWTVGERNLVFYAHDRRVVGWDHEWVQDALTETVVMFLCMGLAANL